ncbi:MAG: hypothetical protein M1826_005095 [Phylliscum demangeonii]|nr:MAG: hypothetical protein M1826_005095 [Phylliscum demangeonii]
MGTTRQVLGASDAYLPAAVAYTALQDIRLSLESKQQRQIPITPPEEERYIKAIDRYTSTMRSYRDAMRSYKTRMLKDHDMKRGADGWSTFVRAEWKDGQLDFRQPIAPPITFRIDREEAERDAYLKTFEVKRARCIKQHCQILHTGLCRPVQGAADEGETGAFYYFFPHLHP